VPNEPPKNGKLPWSGRAIRDTKDVVYALGLATKAGSNARDVYACMSMQSDAMARTSAKGFKWNAPIRLAENAISLKSLFLDIDIKDGPNGYASWDELVSALAMFLYKTGIPKPTMMVNSGGGVHVYWVMDRALTRDEWVPLAASLVEATRQHGLRCDTQCTIDAARVLRIPDTMNWKTDEPRRVHIIGRPLDFDYSVDRMRTALAPFVPSSLPSISSTLIDRELFPTRVFSEGQDADELGVGLDDLRPAPELGDILNQCAFLATAVATGGRDYNQPLWNLTTLIATFTKGGRDDAHKMACGHAEYTTLSTDELFDRKSREKAERGLGWPSCAAISSAGATACNGCAFRAHGKSPLNFEQRPAPAAAGQGNAGGNATFSGTVQATPTGFGGALAVTTPQSNGQQLLAGSLSAAAAPPQTQDLPPGYTRDVNGVVLRYITDPNNPGANTTQAMCDYPMMDAWLQDSPRVLHFDSIVDRNKVTQIDLPLEVTATAEMRKVLQAQGLMLPTKDTGIGEFFVAWVNQLQKIKDSVHSSPFGWLNRAGNIDGFVFGDKLWTPSGSEPAATANAVLAQRYRPKGSDVHWLDAAKLVCGTGRPDLEAIVASAFAAPLVQFTGHKGALMSAFSRESGIGKTTAVTIAQAVWGNPVKGIQGLNDTENAVMGIVGEIKSLPLYWDELKTDQDTKKFVKMTFQISSGKGKSRMNSKAELREPGDWQTLVISASNESLIDHVVSQTNTTAAGLMRIFEYKVAPPSSAGRVSTSDATIRLSKLNNNYGHVGLRYAQFLGANHTQISVDMAALAQQIEKETKADQEERFWVSVVACILLGARYANQIGYAVFDEAALKSFMYNALNEMRNHRKNQTVDLDQSINVSAVLNRFFNDIKKNGSWLVTNRIHVGQGKPAKPPNPNAIMIMQPSDVNHLKGVDVQVGVQNQLLRISSAALGAWCKKNEVNKINLLDALAKSVKLTNVKNARMGAGTLAAGANEHIIEIDLTSSTDLDFVSDML